MRLRSGFRGPGRCMGMNSQRRFPVSIRRAGPHDARALRRLAALDSALPLTGEILLAEASGEPAAALSLTDGASIADPFRPTAELVEMLALRREQLAA